MNLYINSPAYYTQKYGVIDEIYKMCNIISMNIDIRKYTNTIDTIGITPIIAPSKEIKFGLYKEMCRISMKYRIASISLRSDYDRFYDATLDVKKQIIIENIYRSLSVISEKLKEEFDIEGINNDIDLLLKHGPIEEHLTHR